MAGGARFAGGVAGKPFPIGYRAIFSNGRKISIDAGGWRWNLLAQELLPHEETASRGRRVFRLASQGEKEGLPQHSGALLAGRKFGAVEILRWSLHFVHGRKIGVHKSIAGAEHVHEVSVIPNQVPDKTSGFLDHRRNQFGAEQWERSLLPRCR